MSDSAGPRSAEAIISRYMDAFRRQDLAAIAALLTPDVTLQDSFAPRIAGHSRVLDAYRAIFNGDSFELTLLRRFISDGNDGEAQEFRLVITRSTGEKTRVEGVDVFRFRDGLIREIRAYVEAHEVGAAQG